MGGPQPARQDRGSRRWLAIVFLVAAGPLTLFLAVAIPPDQVPDEAAHIARADSVTHAELSGFRQPGNDLQKTPMAAVTADEDLALASLFFAPDTPLAQRQVTLARVWQLMQLDWQHHPDAVAVPNTAVYPPTFYIPAAIAIRVARSSGLGPFLAIFAARLTDALAYVALGTAAIRLARRGQLALLCLLCLPMSLWLAASVNPDGLVIATAALAGALLTRRSRACWWGAAILLAVAAMSKPYLALLACVLPVTYPGRLGRGAWGGMIAAALPAALWNAAMAAFVAVPFIRPPPMPPGPLWDGTPGTIFAANSPHEQLRILLASPLRLITLPVVTLWTHWGVYWREFIGVLGGLDVLLPESMYWAWVGIVVVASLATVLLESRGAAEPTARPIVVTNVVVLSSMIAALVTAFILQYLIWTRVGSALVEGMQGRYAIPIAAVTIPLLQLCRRIHPWRMAAFAAAAGAVSLAALSNAVGLPLLTLFAYYTR